MNAMRLLYDAAGRPPMVGSESGVCRTCGDAGLGILFDDWVKDTFTNFGELVPGDILCHACQFAFDEHSTLLAARVVKDKPQRMRNYSHFVVSREWIPFSKGNKAGMRDILLNLSPDLAVIAVSGQKHILFRAQAGWWQIEEQAMLPDCVSLQGALDTIEALYAGFSKSEIEGGEYRQDRILEFGIGKWRALEARAGALRGSAMFSLALFLAQRGEQDGDIERTDGRLDKPHRDRVEGGRAKRRGKSGRAAAALCPQGVQQIRLGEEAEALLAGF